MKEQVAKIYSLLLWGNKWGYSSRPTFRRLRLILCRDENRTIAEYALRDMAKPIGVSEYHLCTDLPLDLKSALPDPEEIRSRIDMKK